MLVAFFAQGRKESVAWKIQARICGNRFEDYGRNFVFVFTKCLSDKIDTVERQRKR